MLITLVQSAVSSLWGLVDAPHKWACVLTMWLVYHTASAAVVDVAALDTALRYMIYTFVVVGGYARGAEIIAATGLKEAMQALLGKPPANG
jgi:hypothetical protein